MFSAIIGHEEKQEVPVFQINFYAMGQSQVSASLSAAIDSNVAYINEQFEGKVKFRLNKVNAHSNHQWLPDIHDMYRQGQGYMLNDIVGDVESPTGINVFLFKTYCEVDDERSLMGFTPIIGEPNNYYEAYQPMFNRILLSYESLVDAHTLVHEMGHFFGLKHPWELDDNSKTQLGITEMCDNHMAYCDNDMRFTLQQLDAMLLHIRSVRQYLVYYNSITISKV